MLLQDLLDADARCAERHGSHPIAGVSADSRTVKPGFLFAAVPGGKSDGLDYVPAALAAGAVAVVAERAPPTPLPDSVALVLVPDARRALALPAAKFFGHVDIYEYGTNTKVLELGKGLDYAEGFDVSTDDAKVAPGTVLVIDPDTPGELAVSTEPYDRKVAGIVAGAKGLRSGVRLGGDQFEQDVALAGRVYCNVVATDGPIAPGDLLTTSDVPGYAMKVGDRQRAQGAILGKAMEPLAAGSQGKILVLVTLQ